MHATDTVNPFDSMGLHPDVLKSLEILGYEQPTPIQSACIPALIEGHDVIGQAQTGTGKTAAFALPLLSKIDTDKKHPQLIVLAPTRELAIQVAEAMQGYARKLPDFHVVPIYGGQSYDIQLKHLKRGVHAVVGTPGRIMDHIKRKTLDLSNIHSVVLDEADEMLRMGFIEDVQWILGHIPKERQTALFSATMPPPIRKIAQTSMNNPQEISIKSKHSTADTIRQRFWMTPNNSKFDTLARILEFEEFEASLIFVRTKNATIELSEKLEARGYACDALNGDIPQKLRERTIERVKNGQIDIVIATDVAARGLDVDRISHVINYDIPYDTESYVHRIGRTGRAGKTGEAILFVTPREKFMLRTIERHTRNTIEPLKLPTLDEINEQRAQRFKEDVIANLARGIDPAYLDIISELSHEHNLSITDIAASLIQLIHQKEPLFLSEQSLPKITSPKESSKKEKKPKQKQAPTKPQMKKEVSSKLTDKALPLKEFPEIEMERYKLAVGYEHGVKPKNIVGAIANEAEIESCYIGHIEIYDEFCTIDLPSGMPKDTLRHLKKTRICGHRAEIQRVGAAKS